MHVQSCDMAETIKTLGYYIAYGNNECNEKCDIALSAIAKLRSAIDNSNWGFAAICLTKDECLEILKAFESYLDLKGSSADTDCRSSITTMIAAISDLHDIDIISISSSTKYSPKDPDESY